MSAKGSGIWKSVAIILATFIIGLGAGNLTSVSRADVEHIVQTEAPYVKDKGAIGTKLDDLSNQVQDIGRKLDKVIEGEANRGGK